MRGPRAGAIQVSPAQQDVLHRIQRQQTADQRLVRRASLILALSTHPCVEAVAQKLGLTRPTVRAWRDRWLEATEVLQRAEREQTPPQLRRLVELILDDAPRPGRPATFSPEQIVQIIAVACEPPEQSGRPISHWTARELADEVQKRGIVATISPRSVGRFFKRGRVAAAPQPLLAQCRPRGPRRLPSASRCHLRSL
ncbi:MAG: helix-turn-helix domain-containing protein [Planctomycetaceae bacterium]|nr:helix-turn-helix domain-containing protein [Planctomycetaceae bacterium]